MRAQRTAKSAYRRNASTKSASRFSKSPSARKYPETYAECRRWFGLLLTDAQIEKYGKTHRILRKDIPDDVFDTMDRDLFIASVVEDVLGKEYWWPANGDQDEYKQFFWPTFYAVALRKGIKLTAAAKRIAAMYNQIVVTVPEKLGKKITKAVRKKFDIHCIEGGTITSTEGTNVTILANGVNPTLLTIVQVWAEGFAEGAS